MACYSCAIFSRKIYLAASFAPPYEPAILFMHICEAAGAATDIPMLAGRAAEDEGIGGNITCHHRPRADESKCPDSDTAKDYRTCTDRSAELYPRGCYLPIPRIFEPSITSNST